MKITGLSHLFKWENLHNWWLTKHFLPHCIYIYIHIQYMDVLIKYVHFTGRCLKDFVVRFENRPEYNS